MRYLNIKGPPLPSEQDCSREKKGHPALYSSSRWWLLCFPGCPQGIIPLSTPPPAPSWLSYQESDTDVTLKASPRTLTNLHCEGCKATAAATALLLPAAPGSPTPHKPRHRRVSGRRRAALTYQDNHSHRLGMASSLPLLPVLLPSEPAILHPLPSQTQLLSVGRAAASVGLLVW